MKSDIPAIVRLLADDPLGAGCERDPLPRAYYDAFDAISTQSGNQVLVAVEAERVIGCLQLTFISDYNEPLARSDRRIATVDEEIGTRHERGLVAGQKQRTISNFFGPSQPVK